MTPKLLLIFFLLLSLSAKAQSPWLQQQMEAFRTDKHVRKDYSWLETESNRMDVLLKLNPYYADSLPAIRSRALEITLKVGQMSEKLAVRQYVVTRMLSFCTDTSSLVVSRASSLSTFQAEDFSDNARQMLLKIVEKHPRHYASKLVKLLGFVGPPESRVVLYDWLHSGEKMSSRLRRNIQLALARLGDEQAMESLLRNAREVPLSDAMIYDVVPELLYTRRAEAFSFVVELLNSDENACFANNSDTSRKILCGYQLIQMLAPLIGDFPVQLSPTGDLLVEDYSIALRECRSWFAQHTGAYKIRKDVF
jgi:hypothetical protein